MNNTFESNPAAAIEELRVRLMATNQSADDIANATTISAATIYRFMADDNGISIQTYFQLLDFCKSHEKKLANELGKRKRQRVKKRNDQLIEIAIV